MRTIVTFIFLMFTSCTMAHAADVSIVGNWYEESAYQGMRMINVNHIKPDGTFSLTYRVCTPKGPYDGSNTGHWNYRNGVLRVSTETMDNQSVHDVSEYRTESNDGRVWRYVGIAGSSFDREGPKEFRDVRVMPGSKVPDCKLTS